MYVRVRVLMGFTSAVKPHISVSHFCHSSGHLSRTIIPVSIACRLGKTKEEKLAQSRARLWTSSATHRLRKMAEAEAATATEGTRAELWRQDDAFAEAL